MGNKFGADILIQAPDPKVAAPFYVKELGFEITEETSNMIMCTLRNPIFMKNLLVLVLLALGSGIIARSLQRFSRRLFGQFDFVNVTDS